MAGEPEYEPVLFGGGGDVGGQCALCGGGGARVECAACGAGARCASCDAMYHRHPKRAHHRRQIKQCDQKLPPLPARSQNVQSSTPPPLPARALSTQNLLSLRRQTLPIQRNETTLHPANNKPRGSLPVAPAMGGTTPRALPSGRAPPPALPARPQQRPPVPAGQGLTRAISALVVSGSPVPPPRKNKRIQGSQNVLGPGLMHNVGPMGMGLEGVAMAGVGGAGGAAPGTRWGGSCLNLHAAQQLGWFAPPPWHWPPMPPAPPKAVERRPSTRSLAFGDWQPPKYNLNPWLANGREAHQARYSSEEDEEASPPLSVSSPHNLSSRNRLRSPSQRSRCGSARRSVNSNATPGYSTCSHDSRPSSAGPHDADVRVNHRSRRCSSPKTMPRYKKNRNDESGPGSSEENYRSKRSTPDSRRTSGAHQPSSRTSSPITDGAKRRERRHSMRTSRDWGSRNRLETKPPFDNDMINDRSNKNEYHLQDQSFESRKYSLKTTTDKDTNKNSSNTSRRRSCSNNRSQIQETKPSSPPTEFRGSKYQLDSRRQVHDSKPFRPSSRHKSRGYSSDTESYESSDSYKEKRHSIVPDRKDRKQSTEPTRPMRNPSKHNSVFKRSSSVSSSHNIDSRSSRRSSPEARPSSRNLSHRGKSRTCTRNENESGCSGEWACRHCTFMNSGGAGGGVCALCCRTTTPPTRDPDNHNNSSSSFSNNETSEKEDNKTHILGDSDRNRGENIGRCQEKIKSSTAIQTDRSNPEYEKNEISRRISESTKGDGKFNTNNIENTKYHRFSQSEDKINKFQNIQSRKCDASTSPIRDIDKKISATTLHNINTTPSKNLNKVIENSSTNTEKSISYTSGTSGLKYVKCDAVVSTPSATLEPKSHRTISTGINASTMTGSLDESEVELNTNHNRVAENNNIPIRIDTGTSTEPVQHIVIPDRGHFGQLNRYVSVAEKKLGNPITLHSDAQTSTGQVEPGFVKIIADLQPTLVRGSNYETTVIIPRDMSPSIEVGSSRVAGIKEIGQSLVQTATIPLKQQASGAASSIDVGTSTEFYEPRALVVTNLSSDTNRALKTQSKVLVDSGTSMASDTSSTLKTRSKVLVDSETSMASDTSSTLKTQSKVLVASETSMASDTSSTLKTRSKLLVDSGTSMADIHSTSKGTLDLTTTRQTSLLPNFSDWLQSSNNLNQSIQANNINLNEMEPGLSQIKAIDQNHIFNKTLMTTDMNKFIEFKTQPKFFNGTDSKNNSNNIDNSEQWHLAEEYPQPIESNLQLINSQVDTDSDGKGRKVNEKTSIYEIDDLPISNHHLYANSGEDSSNIYIKENEERQQIVTTDTRSLNEPTSDGIPVETITKKNGGVTFLNRLQKITNNSSNYPNNTIKELKQENAKSEINIGTELLLKSKSVLNKDHSDIIRNTSESSQIELFIESEPNKNQLNLNPILEFKSDSSMQAITAIEDFRHKAIRDTHLSPQAETYQVLKQQNDTKQHEADYIQDTSNDMITPALIKTDDQEDILKKQNHEPQDIPKANTLFRKEGLLKEQANKIMSNDHYFPETAPGNLEVQEAVFNGHLETKSFEIAMAVTEGNSILNCNDLDKNTMLPREFSPTNNQLFETRKIVTDKEKNYVNEHHNRLRSPSVDVTLPGSSLLIQNINHNNLKSDPKMIVEFQNINGSTFSNNNTEDDSGNECIDAERQFQQACSDLAATERYSEGDEKDEFYLAESVQNLSDIVDNTHRLIQQMKDEISTDLTSFESADTDEMWSDDESTIASSSRESRSERSTSRESSVQTESCSTSSSIQNFNAGLREKVAQLDALCAHLPTSLNEGVVLNKSIDHSDQTLSLEKIPSVNNDEAVVMDNKIFTNLYEPSTAIVDTELASSDTVTVLTDSKSPITNEEVISSKIDEKIITSNTDNVRDLILNKPSLEETVADIISSSETNYLYLSQMSVEESMAAPTEYNQQIQEKYTQSNEKNYMFSDKLSQNSNSAVSEQIANSTACHSSPSTEAVASSDMNTNSSISRDENNETSLQNNMDTKCWKHPETINNDSSDRKSESNSNLIVASVMKKFNTKIPVSRLPIRRPIVPKQNGKQNNSAKNNSPKANSSNVKNIQTKLFGEQKNLQASRNNFVKSIKEKKAAVRKFSHTETEPAKTDSKVNGTEIQPAETNICEKEQVCQFKENINCTESLTHDTVPEECKNNVTPLEEKSQDMILLNTNEVQNSEAEKQTVRLVQGRRVDLALAPDVRGQSPERAAAELVRGGWASTREVALLAVALRDVPMGDALVAAHECSTEQEARAFLRRECALCAGVAPEHRTRAMLACTHRCCEDCAAQHFALVVRERSVLDAACPFCGEPNLTALSDDDRTQYLALLEGMLRTLLSQELLDLFQRKLRDYTLHTDPAFRWCHECSSGYFVGEEIEEEGRVRCPECSAGACGRCRAPWPVASARHTCLAGAAAGAGAGARALHGTREERALVADEDAVLCPRCGRRYELARGGCMHFTCALCRYEFCGSCGEQFSVGALCPLALPACAALGLHAHHPRNCLFYLRDKTPERLEALLREHAVPVPAAVDEGEGAQCSVGVTREMVSGARVEGRCGGEARAAWGGRCRMHWVERLGALVRHHQLDPAPLLDVAELECVVRRAGLRPPPRPAHAAPHAPIHRNALLQIIKDKIPLK